MSIGMRVRLNGVGRIGSITCKGRKGFICVLWSLQGVCTWEKQADLQPI